MDFAGKYFALLLMGLLLFGCVSPVKNCDSDSACLNAALLDCAPAKGVLWNGLTLEGNSTVNKTTFVEIEGVEEKPYYETACKIKIQTPEVVFKCPVKKTVAESGKQIGEIVQQCIFIRPYLGITG